MIRLNDQADGDVEDDVEGVDPVEVDGGQLPRLNYAAQILLHNSSMNPSESFADPSTTWTSAGSRCWKLTTARSYKIDS